jgi:hypothetical protein
VQIYYQTVTGMNADLTGARIVRAVSVSIASAARLTASSQVPEVLEAQAARQQAAAAAAAAAADVEDPAVLSAAMAEVVRAVRAGEIALPAGDDDDDDDAAASSGEEAAGADTDSGSGSESGSGSDSESDGRDLGKELGAMSKQVRRVGSRERSPSHAV